MVLLYFFLPAIEVGFLHQIEVHQYQMFVHGTFHLLLDNKLNNQTGLFDTNRLIQCLKQFWPADHDKKLP